MMPKDNKDSLEFGVEFASVKMYEQVTKNNFSSFMVYSRKNS